MIGYIIAVISSLTVVFLLWKLRKCYEKIDELERETFFKNAENKRRLDAELDKNNKLQSKISTTKCLICQEPSNGKHFCFSCYSKYKNRSIDIRIKECISAEIIDPYGNLSIKCDDGRKVRSRAEALISNFFYNNKIRSVYEKEIYYQENGKDKILHPDFYLPDYDVYIEYNEITKKSYLKSKEYTQRIYAQLGLRVIIMDDKDLNSIAGCLKPKLGIN